ncbi:hypothetical protein BKA70DRAFT_1035594, partial [Coprinopsis sp. MPI-PUGE-AT-0042]
LLSKDHPQFESHGLKFRASSVVPVLLGPHLSRRLPGSENEIWARDMLLLFRPWRSIEALKGPFASWSQAFENYERHLTPQQWKTIQNMEVLVRARE